MTMFDNAISVLKACTIEGLVVKLPAEQLDRKVYQETAKKLELIGGKWNRKYQGFIFKADPTDLLQDIQNGENRNLQKEYQFFETPEDIARWMVQMAMILPDHVILEPSAGQGALIDAFYLEHPNAKNLIFCVEKMATNQIILNKKYNQHEYVHIMHPLNDDFLELDKYQQYDIIIANPPFSKNQDIEHIYAMWDVLKPGGRLVTVASKHHEFASGKKEDMFRQFLKEKDASSYPLDNGRFKESGTMVASVILVIDKPEGNG